MRDGAGPLTELGRRIHGIARAKGFYDRPHNLVEHLALMHSEISEALEELRAAPQPGLAITTQHVYFHDDPKGHEKPEGFVVELADALIRILDTLTYVGVDIDAIVQLKVDYNESRDFMHGGRRM
jgi:hypothetical protein